MNPGTNSDTGADADAHRLPQIAGSIGRAHDRLT